MESSDSDLELYKRRQPSTGSPRAESAGHTFTKKRLNRSAVLSDSDDNTAFPSIVDEDIPGDSVRNVVKDDSDMPDEISPDFGRVNPAKQSVNRVGRRKIMCNSDSDSDKEKSHVSSRLSSGQASNAEENHTDKEKTGNDSGSGLSDGLDILKPKKKKLVKKVKKPTKERKGSDSEATPSWKKTLDSGIFSSGDSDSDVGRPDYGKEDLEDLGEIKKNARHKSHKTTKREQGTNSTKKSQEKRKDDLLKLHSDSQKLVRQARISVPYHKPKQRTLQEFLNMKSLKVTPTHGKSLRIREEELEPVIKQLKDREKEIEEFFKSDSEEETPEDKPSESQIADPSELCIADPSTELCLLTASQATVDFDSSASIVGTQCEVQMPGGITDFTELNSSGADRALEMSGATREGLENVGTSLDLFSEYDQPSTKGGPSKVYECGSLDLFNDNGEVGTAIEDVKVPEPVVEALPEKENHESDKVSSDDDFSLCVESESILSERGLKTVMDPSGESLSGADKDQQSLEGIRKSGAESGREKKEQRRERTAGSPSKSGKEQKPSEEPSTDSGMEQNIPSGSPPRSGKDDSSLCLEIESQDLVPTVTLGDRKKTLLASLKAPKLSGKPGQEIDFFSPEDSVLSLQERFAKHARATRSPAKKDVTLSVVKKEVGPDGKESLTHDVITFKPDTTKEKRANLRELKETLMKQLDAKRVMEMKKLMEERMKNGEQMDRDGVEENIENLLDMEEEEELSDRDSQEEDEENSENEAERNEFLDAEADEESENDDTENVDDNDEVQIREEAEEFDEADDGSSVPFVFPSLQSQTEDLEPSGLSQLIDKSVNQSIDDDDLMALCSGKFETQPGQAEEIEQDSKQEEQVVTNQEARLRKRITIDSDQSDEEQEVTPVPLLADVEVGSKEVDLNSDDDSHKKESKRRKRLVLSDDDSDTERLDELEAESDDNDASGDELISLDEDADVVYDSDENEIPTALVNNKGKLRKDFLENEAELSGSELGSGDENEEGLDEYEADEGDNEVFDQDELRNQVEKIHLKSIIDEDQRDVRLLQELFLEDGELQADGPGRERRFRWANLGADDGDDNDRKNSDDELQDDDGLDVETWRKERHEREQFLNQNQEETDLISTSESQLLSMGKKVLVKTTRTKTTLTTISEERPDPVRPLMAAPDSPDFKKKGMPVKRGSFLSFKEDVLTRLAVITKGNAPAQDGAMNKGGSSKHSCVFATVTPPQKKESEKRKKEEPTAGATPKRIKLKQEKKPSEGQRKIGSIFSHISS